MNIKGTIFINQQVLFGFFFLFLSYFLHQYALAITMEFGFILVDTSSNIFRQMDLVFHRSDTAIE